jgi:glycogen operon protein
VVLTLVMDSLRYWVEEMHVDGFRFDLAATLARGAPGGFDRNGAFLAAVRQDPVLARVKLFAEPWDVSEGGYQLGNFPSGWSEWNDKYRDAVRSYWKGDGGRVAELASRLSGSSDVFERSGRGPASSVNFVATHDGFTLHDLVSYEKKRNEANLEDNRDGSSDDRSANYGVEGPTDNREIISLREKQKRNLLATLLFSQGVPLLLAGDEMGRTQQGNNNAYCHDSELSWIDWDLGEDAKALLEFTRGLIALRNAHPLFRRRTWFRGRAEHDPELKDVVWLNYQGIEMTEAEWTRSSARCLGVLLSGRGLSERDAHGAPVEDQDLLLLLNSNPGDVPFPLPSGRWNLLLDTAIEKPEFEKTYLLQGRSLALLAKPSSKDPARTDG